MRTGAPPSPADAALCRAEAFRQMVFSQVSMDPPGAPPTAPAAPATASSETLIEKTIWGSPAGKKRLAARLVKLVPAHKVYVEPFAGSGAVFFEKPQSDTEVLGDADPEIAAAFKALATLTDRELAALKKKDWTGRERIFRELQDGTPRGKVGKLYRFLYLSHFSYGKLRGKSYNQNAEGVEARTIDRIEKYRDRLRGVKVRSAHYADVVKEFDGTDTFFFLDPPYPGHNVEVGEDRFDEAEFRKILDSIKGKFLITYGTRGELDTSGFHVRKIRTPRTIRTMRGVEGPKTLPQLLIANYAITEKALGPYALDEVEAEMELDGDAAADLDYARALAKALASEADEPRIVALARELDRIDGAGDERIAVLARQLLPLGDRLASVLEAVVPVAASALHEAAPVLEALANVEKARMVPFQQWGGSSKYARRLAERLPAHKCYVEPFCGAAAVFFAKSAAPEEVLADADPEVIFAHRYIQRLDSSTFSALKRFSWKVSRAGFERAKACDPASDAERFWKLVYGRVCTWGAKPNMSGFASIHDGQTYDLDDLWPFHERLKSVRLVTQDWKKTLTEHDGPDTFFFIDPPYEDEWAVGDGVPAADIAEAVSQLKGQYVVAYTDSADARRALAKIGRPFTLRVPEGRGAGQWQKRSRLFVASSGLKKADDFDYLDADVAQPPSTLSIMLDKPIPLLKTGEERYVLGIVLEPETVDAQKDIYSSAEVREAAHLFMEEYQNVGLMHRGLVNGKVKILESYLAPTTFELDGTQVRKGTWLLAVRVLDDALWEQIKSGAISGFSIGGTAQRQ